MMSKPLTLQEFSSTQKMLKECTTSLTPAQEAKRQELINKDKLAARDQLFAISLMIRRMKSY